VRRYPALVAVLLATAALTAPSALADSIVYERDGNVWLANPDGSGQRQVTTAGGYGKPSQADDGTIMAAKDAVLHHLSRSGQLLNLAGDDDYGGKIFTDFSPNGALASYGFFASGPILTGPYAAVSHSSRPTEKEEIDGPLSGYLNPSWLDNTHVLLFPQSLSIDVQIWPIPGDIEDWFEDPDFDLGGGDVDRAMTKFASTADGGSSIVLYRLPAPPPALPERRCQVTGPAGSFFRPTWSPDGSTLAWQEDDGIHTLRIDLETCSGESSLAIPGGKHPDWGPADVGSPAGPGPGTGTGPGSGPGPGPGGTTGLSATVPRRVRLRALLRGLNVKVNCTCTATVKLLLKSRTIGKAKKAVVGSAKVKVKPTRAGKARLRRGGRSVSVRVAGAGRVVTKKVKIIR
jgi:hypothetical protein